MHLVAPVAWLSEHTSVVPVSSLESEFLKSLDKQNSECMKQLKRFRQRKSLMSITTNIKQHLVIPIHWLFNATQVFACFLLTLNLALVVCVHRNGFINTGGFIISETLLQTYCQAGARKLQWGSFCSSAKWIYALIDPLSLPPAAGLGGRLTVCEWQQKGSGGFKSKQSDKMTPQK